MSDQGGEESQQGPNIIIQPDQMAGAWANFAKVSQSPYEFTIDFCRLDFSQQPPQGIVVSRVSLSPLFISQLIEALNSEWHRYAQRALPQEVYEEPPQDSPSQGYPDITPPSEDDDEDDD